MPSRNSKNSSPKHKPQDFTPAIAVDVNSGEMRDIVSAPPAVPSVSPGAGPSVEFSHRTMAYGCWIETLWDHTKARLTPVEGPPVEFSSKVGDDPSAFSRAIQEAKQAWRERLAKEEAETLRRRQDLIDAATAANTKGAK